MGRWDGGVLQTVKSECCELCVVGGGPAGLRAAEVASDAGARVALFEAMPSVGRKFLIAGRGGLNLTKVDDGFAGRFSGPSMPALLWPGILAEFGPEETRAWAAGLGVETFVGSGKRVYPVGLKAAPLLRRWVVRLRAQGVRFFPRHRWCGLTRATESSEGFPWDVYFQTPSGSCSVSAGAVVLALGGGSWPSTGSDGGWVPVIKEMGVGVEPLVSANCGWEVEWPPEFLAEAEGRPLKNISVSAGGHTVFGELLITGYGLEGGAIYAITPALRPMADPCVHIDLKPAFSLEQLLSRMSAAKRLHVHEACERWRLDATARLLLAHHPLRSSWTSVAGLAAAVKACPIRLRGPRALAEAISSAGGVRWSEMNSELMVTAMPGIFLAGEMLDWEAPTGGYLIQGCLSTGTRAGREAARWLAKP